MATRMQQRRGTAAQWISTNNGDGPVLNAGEIGFELDTNKFKIGDGVNHWIDLPYFANNEAITDLIDGAPALLDTLNELAASIGDDPDFIGTVTAHTSATTNVHGIADTAALATKSYADQAETDAISAAGSAADIKVSDHNAETTNVHGIANTADLATQDYVTDAIANSTGEYPLLVGDGLAWNAVDETFEVDSSILRASEIQTALDLKANLESPTFTGTVAGITKAMVGLSDVDNTSDADKPISTSTQTALDLKANKLDPTFYGTVTSTNDVVVNGNLTVNGTTFSASSTSITIEDNMLQLAHENPANTVDLGLVVAYNDGSTKHAGIVRDVSADRWRLFKDVTTEPTTAIDFTLASYDDLQVGQFIADGAEIGNVTDTEIQYLNGVTSAIQDQLDAKLASSTAASTYAPIASPTFTGTVSGITKNMVGLNNVDNTADADKDISNLTQAALDLKAPLANPTFTGTVSGIDKSMVALGNVDNTSDLNKPVSTATQTALDLKANVDGATLTGTVTLPSSTSVGTVTSTEIGYLSGVTASIQDQLDDRTPTADLTKSMVGLSNVDNTADADKPISTDTQAALDLKAPLNDPTFTGTVSGVTKSMVGLGNVDNTSDADKPVSSATQAALDDKYDTATATSALAEKAPLESPTFTGTVSGITKLMVGLGNVDNTTDANKPVSTATQTALDLKANLAGATFTGDVTVETHLIVDGNLTVSGTTTTVSAQDLVVSDPLIYIGEGNTDNLVDLGLVSSYNDGTYQHSGIVRDASAGKWKIFKGVTDEPTTTINFAQGSLDALAVGAFEATTVTPSSGVVFSDGTQTKAGVPSLTPITLQEGPYTLSSLSERDSLIEADPSLMGAFTITIPVDSVLNFPIGTSINILQTQEGEISIAGAVGVTVNATPGLKLRAQWSSATLFKRAANTWVVYGDLKA